MRPRILFGDHATQSPAIARFIDRDRIDPVFGPIAGTDPTGFDMVVPLRIEEIEPARASNTDRRRTVLPTAELVALCDDKLAFTERLIALGFADDVPALLPDPPGELPYVRKARRGDFGQGIRIVHAAADDAPPIRDSFCQRAVAGADEYVLHLLRVDGRIVYSLCYRYDMGAPLTVRGAGQAAVAVVPADPAGALPRCTAILDALGFEGLCCFNYKWEEGALRILELNPRFGGSLVGEVTGYCLAQLDAMAAATNRAVPR